MGNDIATIILRFTVLLNHSNCFQIIGRSKDTTIRKGDSYFVYCSTDEPYETCRFKKDGETLCRTVEDDETNQLNNTICSKNSRFNRILDSNLCGVRIDNVNDTDVATPTIVIPYQGIRKMPSPLSSPNANSMDLQCIESNGYPKPAISASIEKLSSHNGPALDSIPLNKTEINGNTSNFNINISPDLCKYTLKCSALQIEEKSGNVLYENSDVSNRTLCNVFTFLKPNESLTIDIPFIPTSDTFQVEWNIKTTIENNVRIRPGNKYRNDAFVAERIKNTRDGRSVSLKITNMSLVDLSRLHYLNINSGKSGRYSKQYGFFVLQKGNL